MKIHGGILITFLNVRAALLSTAVVDVVLDCRGRDPYRCSTQQPLAVPPVLDPVEPYSTVLVYSRQQRLRPCAAATWLLHGCV
eukprot:COSAG01_NODE_49492_length_371_cov_3.213235_1_plen_82_part_01